MRKFMRTRAADEPAPLPPPPPPAHPPDSLTALNGHGHKSNGHANGAADHHSTLSRRGSGSQGSGALFEDAAFPASWRALGSRRLARRLHWLRPHEVCERPRFLGDDGAAPPDDLADRWCSLTVGEAGDEHVCRAAAALALTPSLLARAAPPQGFRAGYSGAFRFRFWVFGEWREVLVDDRLPAAGARLLCSRAAPDDFTLPLLEKAYAKLHGSYAALHGGGAARALRALSGGAVQSVALRRTPRAAALQLLHAAAPRASLLLAAPAPARAARAPPCALAGLARARPGPAAPGAAPSGPAPAGPAPAPLALVLLRAVGSRVAWRGAWARDSPEWRALAPHDRDLLQQRADRPGDFWMSFDDFMQTFSQLELVHVGPDDWLLERALHARRPWRAVLARRRWRAGYNAGGPPRCSDTTGTNPQFHVEIPRSEAAGARKCHVVVSVTQQYEPGAARRPLAVGFALYELPARARPRHDLRALRPLDAAHESRALEVATFFTLPPGRYLVVPHTRRPHTDAAFLLRILTDEQTDVWYARPPRPAPAARGPRSPCSPRLLQGGERGQRDRARRGGRAGGRGGGAAGGGARGGGAAGRARPGRRGAGRARAARGAAARVARVPERAAVAGAVPRAGGAARPRAGGLRARRRRARAAGAAGVLARRLPARGRRAALRRARLLVLPPARAAVGGRRHGLQQGAGVPRAALRARLRAHRGGLRHGAGPPAPRARTLPQPGHQDKVQPVVTGGDDPDDHLLVAARALLAFLRSCYSYIFLLSVI